MKKLIALLGLSTSLMAAPPGVQWNVVWTDTNNIPALNQYVPTTNNCYILVGTNDLSSPVTSWPVLATYTNWTLGTNGGKIWYTNVVVLTPPSSGQSFYVSVISSNAWGMAAPPSAVAQTGPVSTPPASLILSR